MKRLLSAMMLLTATTLFFCGRHPSGPLADPDDAVVEFLTGDTNHTVQIGTPLQMGLVVSRPLFVDTIHLTSSCGGFDTTLSPDPVETADTLYFYPVFSREGTCTVYARAILYEKEHGEKTDSLSIEVRATPEKIVFTRIPQDFATFVGRADTLFFIATINGDSSSIQFSISSDPPLETAHLYPITAFSGDIGRYVFVADTADTSLLPLVPLPGRFPTR
jgi:predicted small lipoprotein YifL